MEGRIRPAVFGNVPVLTFCVGAGLVGVMVDDVPAAVRISGVALGAIAVFYVVLLFTTWFQFGDCDAQVSALGRVRNFSAGETTLQMHRFSMGFFAEQVGVELRSPDAHVTVPLSAFSRKNRMLIESELRNRFGAASMN